MGHIMVEKTDLDKIVMITGFILVMFILLIIIITPIASGYEINIYNMYPLYFWFLVSFSILCGSMVIVRRAFEENRSDLWKIGFSLILLTNLIVLLLPFFRGYLTFGRGDVLSHVGFTKDILVLGHTLPAGTAGENIYPALHTLLASLVFTTGLSPETLSLILTPVVMVFYIVSIFLLIRVLTNNKNASLIVLAFGSLLMFKPNNLMLTPSIIAFFLLPITLFLFYITRKRVRTSISNYSIIFLIFIILIPFLHPGEGTIFLMIIILLIGLSLSIYKYLNISEKEYHLNKFFNIKNSLNILLILFITWFTWFTSFSVYLQQAKRTINWLFYGNGITTAFQYSNILGRTNMSLSQFINLITVTYGQDLIYLVVSTVICAYILKMVISKKKLNFEIFTFGSLFFITMVLLVFFYFNEFGLDFNREMKYIIFIATILNGLALFTFFNRSKYKKLGMTLIILLLFTSSTIAIFNTFGSPITKSPNFQVTNMDVMGMRWFLDNRNESLPINSIDPFTNARLVNELRGMQLRGVTILDLKTAPEHFNYTNKTTFGGSFQASSNPQGYNYFIDWKLTRIVYPSIFPEYKDQWKFTPEDFYKLNNEDPTVNLVYSDGEFWVYFVVGK